MKIDLSHEEVEDLISACEAAERHALSVEYRYKYCLLRERLEEYNTPEEDNEPIG